jgi:hypothetical protein
MRKPAAGGEAKKQALNAARLLQHARGCGAY